MKNKIVGGLILVTGLSFIGAVFTDVPNLFKLGMIAGTSAIFTKLLIGETK